MNNNGCRRIKFRRVRARQAALSVFLCLVVLGGGACKKEGGLAKSNVAAAGADVTSAARAPQEQLPAKNEQTSLSPLMFLSVEGGAETSVFRGWPIRGTLELAHPSIQKEVKEVAPLLLASDTGNWTDVVKLETVSSGGEKVSFPFRRVPQKEKTVSLGPDAAVTLVFWLAPEDSARIPQGTYQITAVLDTSRVKVPGVWKGKAESETVTLSIEAEPSPLSDSQAEDKSLLLAGFLADAGKTEEALATIGRLLQERPESVSGLTMKGDLLASSGKMEEALKAYESALRAFGTAYPNADEPPRALWRKYNSALAEILKR